MVELSVALLSSVGLPGIYAVAALELLLPPIPGEVVMALAGFLASRGRAELWQVVAAGTLGNLTGGLIQYLMGLKVARPVLVKLGKYMRFSERDLEKAEDFFRRKGFGAVVAGRLVPGVRSIISIPAGMARMSVAAFTAATAAGSLPWNAIFAYMGYKLEENWHLVQMYSGYLDAAGALAIAAVVAYALLKIAGKGFNRKGSSNHRERTPPALSGTRAVGT